MLSINLNAEQEARVKALHNKERETSTEFVQRCFDVGLSTLEYRKDSYPKTKERNKRARQALKVVESNPELAKKAGFAREGDGSTGVQRIS